MKTRMQKQIMNGLQLSLPEGTLFYFGCIIILSLIFTSGYFFFQNQKLGEQLRTVTHEAEILNAEIPDPVIKYSGLLVGADNPVIKELAVSLGGPGEIYLFVRDNIEYSENYDEKRSALEVLENRKGDCLGQADLLAGLLLAYGYSPDDVAVSMGYVTFNGERRHHAWVEFNLNGKWIALDPSKFLGTFEMDRWSREDFYRAYNVHPYTKFNNVYVHMNVGSQRDISAFY